jgi:putative ABC transport system permease protein
VETFLQDLRFGYRNLMKTRGLAVVAIITLALGIGANTAIFSVIDAVLLRPLPFTRPGELVRLYETEAAPGNYPFTGPDFLDWKSQNKSFQDMTLLSWPRDYALTANGEAERVIGVPTEWNFFSLLGVRPLLGRTWAEGEDMPGKDDVCILSYGIWKSRFGGDAGILNKSVELSGRKYTIVGVMPPEFHYPTAAQLWTPLTMDSKSLGSRGSHQFWALGRLRPGVPLQQAQAEMSLIAMQLEKQYPQSNHKVGASLVAMHEDVVGKSRDSLIMMLWAVALVLLIACANVANLLLSRALARQKEMAIRSALGAARIRLVRQLLTESVLLAATGGALGLMLASGLVWVISNAKQVAVPRLNAIELNMPVLAFTFGVAVLSGIVFGIIPALQTSRPDLHDELKGGAGAAVTHSRTRRLTSSVLVVAEIGLSLLLLVAAGLLLKDFSALRNTETGVRTENTWTAALRLPEAAYKDDRKQYEFGETLLAKLKQIPGVESAALTTTLPTLGGSNRTSTFAEKSSSR